MDAKELVKVPPGLPRWHWMARHHPMELVFWVAGLMAGIYALYALWPS